MQIYNKILKENNSDRGFTLIEIMVALMLITIVFTLIPSNNANNLHNKISETVEDIQRAVRFTTNESILKNSIVRIVFVLNETNTEYYIEASNSSSLALEKDVDTERLSIRERESFLEKKKGQDQQFVKVDEFSDKKNVLPDGVNLIGLGNSQSEKILQDDQLFIYFYPSGEKDNSILFLSTEDEMATLEISSFENRFHSDFIIYSKSTSNNLEYTMKTTMEDLFSKWRKK